MTEAEIFAKIVEITEPLDEITLDTQIADCDDLDSLALFNIVVDFKQLGLVTTLQETLKCNTVRELVQLLANKQA